RKVKRRNSANSKVCRIDCGVSAHFHDHLVGEELPFGMRQLACCNGSLSHDIAVRPGFFDDAPSEKESIRCGRQDVAPAELQSNARVYMFEASGFVLYVVGSACGFNVLVVGTPIEYQMPLGGYVAGIGVVGGFVA